MLQPLWPARRRVDGGPPQRLFAGLYGWHGVRRRPLCAAVTPSRRRSRRYSGDEAAIDQGERSAGVRPVRIGGGSTRCRRCDQRDGRTAGECRSPCRALAATRASGPAVARDGRATAQRTDHRGAGQRREPRRRRPRRGVARLHPALAARARLAARAWRRRERQHMSARTYNRNKMSSVPLLRVRDR